MASGIGGRAAKSKFSSPAGDGEALRRELMAQMFSGPGSSSTAITCAARARSAE